MLLHLHINKSSMFLNGTFIFFWIKIFWLQVIFAIVYIQTFIADEKYPFAKTSVRI